MLNVYDDTGLFTIYGVGAYSNFHIFHLQFVDDTLISGENSWWEYHNFED